MYRAQTFTGEHLTELLKKLIALDKDWIPTEPGYSLYVRPTMIGTQAGLGVGASSDALLFVILSPVRRHVVSESTLAKWALWR